MQMFVDDYLTLRLVWLKRTETWLNQSPAFSFVLAQGGRSSDIPSDEYSRDQVGLRLTYQL
jgi:hypothetical protein